MLLSSARARRFFLAMCVGAGISGCSVDSPTGISKQAPPDDPGRLVASDFFDRGYSFFYYLPSLVWSPSSDMLFFLSARQLGATVTTTLNSVPASGGAVMSHRILRQNAQAMMWGDAGSVVYSAPSTSGEGYDINRAPLSGSAEVTLTAAASNVFAMSADGNRLFHRDHSATAAPAFLRVLDLATGTRWAVTPTSLPLALSPTGNELLLERLTGNERSIEVVPLTGGASRVVHTENIGGSLNLPRLVLARWEADGLHFLLVTQVAGGGTSRYRYTDRSVVSGQEILIAELPDVALLAWWSPDRRRLGHWRSGECYRSSGEILAICQLRRHELMIEEAGKPPLLAATLNAVDGLPATLPSPDGHRIAYSLAGHLYVKDLP